MLDNSPAPQKIAVYRRAAIRPSLSIRRERALHTAHTPQSNYQLHALAHGVCSVLSSQ
jgi:hypothetical protein